MDLLPDDLFDKTPRLYATENTPDPTVHIKYFTPDASWSWFVTEVDQDRDLMFGLVNGFEVELGYFSLSELKTVRGSLGLPVERDLYFTPKPLSLVQSEIRARWMGRR